MAVDDFSDLDPVEELLVRCNQCGSCFGTERQVKIHQGNSDTCEKVDGED